jgi:mono/diheme cytochrome c family protein
MTMAALTTLLGAAVGVAAESAEGIKNPFEGQTELIDEGKSLFNQYCSHCHGPDAVQGERVRDLRRLTRRYGDDATKTFYTTINNGRMEKGMPVWKGVLSEDVMWRIYTFLQSVQAQ